MSIKQRIFTPFFIALQFLTVVPIRLAAMPSARQNAWAVLFYPVIGLLIGGLLLAVALVLSKLPVILLSSLILLLWIWLTGGLHLDGLADTADAWVGGFGDTERTLAIMKDPACGPIGVLSLLLCCLLKWSALYVLLSTSYIILLLFLPMLGRMSPLLLFLTTPYVRAKGLGLVIAQYFPRPLAIVVLIIFSLLFIAIWQVLAMLLISILILTIAYLRYKFIQRIGGITGDTVGASIEIVEVVALISSCMLLSYSVL